jgi:hypothetical protein
MANGFFGKGIVEEAAERQRAACSNASTLATGQGMAASGITNGMIGASQASIQAHRPWDDVCIQAPSTNVIGADEKGDLRHEVERTVREKEFLDWLYNLRVGEYGIFADGYHVYLRTLAGWTYSPVGHPEMTDVMPFTPREDIPR